MSNRINPFNELYVTETIGSADFVRIFSTSILRNAQALFLPGNVVVQGVQGSGKSMLLSLLKPEVRIAYAEAEEKFPVSDRFARFIGAGINLTRSRAIDFGQRAIEPNRTDESDILPLYFGDFLNYWIVFDVLKSVDSLGGYPHKRRLDVSPRVDPARLNDFATRLARDDCWFGYLSDVNDYQSLKDRLSERLTKYLSFLNFNLDSLPPQLTESKTSVGAPVSRTVNHLRGADVIDDDVELFVRIDQYEELTRLEGVYKTVGPLYRRVVNKAVGLRDPRVSYRIGTRRYAWTEDRQFFGTTGKLEEDRNYKTIDLDEILRRKESVKTWIFPEFAEDVFKKRLAFAGYADSVENHLSHVFGKGFTPEEKARHYAGKSSSRVVKLGDDWSEDWKSFIARLGEDEPLSARLAEAWVRQKGGTTDMPEQPFPWEQKNYWRKERLGQALMQIAGRSGQRMIWAGREEILQLSGGNILVFVSLCQHIWDAWLRTNTKEEKSLPRIDPMIQAVGIQEASTHWFQKIEEEDSGGSSRQRFVRHVGGLLEKKMFDDLPQSYPGNNGFSLTMADLEADPLVRRFLNDAVAHGDLFDAPHTTKEKSRRQRRKWYLNPILAPHFRLPESRTKEPMYVTLNEVRDWMRKVGLEVGKDEVPGLKSKLPRKAKTVSSHKQSTLFAETEE